MSIYLYMLYINISESILNNSSTFIYWTLMLYIIVIQRNRFLITFTASSNSLYTDRTLFNNLYNTMKPMQYSR